MYMKTHWSGLSLVCRLIQNLKRIKKPGAYVYAALQYMFAFSRLGVRVDADGLWFEERLICP